MDAETSAAAGELLVDMESGEVKEIQQCGTVETVQLKKLKKQK